MKKVLGKLNMIRTVKLLVLLAVFWGVFINNHNIVVSDWSVVGPKVLVYKNSVDGIGDDIRRADNICISVGGSHDGLYDTTYGKPFVVYEEKKGVCNGEVASRSVYPVGVLLNTIVFFGPLTVIYVIIKRIRGKNNG